MVTFGLNGEPGELTELPGVTGLARPQVLAGAPGCPVVGVCNVSPARAVAPVARVRAMTQNALAVTFLMSLPMSTSRLGEFAAAFTISYWGVLRPGKTADETDHGVDAPVVVVDHQALVRRVNGGVGLGDPADHERSPDGLLEVDRHWNRPAHADQRGLLAEGLLVSRPHGPRGIVIHPTSHRRRGAEEVDPDLDSWSGELLDLLLEGGQDRLPVLVRHQSHAHFGRRPRGDHGFLTFADEAAHDSVRIEGGPAAGPLEREEPFLTLEGPRARQTHHRLGVPLVLLLPVRQLLRARPDDGVVEAGNGDVAVAVLQLPAYACQRVDRVGRHSAVHA